MSRNSTVETYKHRGCVIRVEVDDDPASPREDDNVGTMVCWHRRYNLGDEQPKMDSDDWIRQLAADAVKANDRDAIPKVHVNSILDKHFVMLPLFLMDHSGISMSCSSFHDPWDSGRVGLIYCTMDKARKEWGDLPVADLRAKATKCMMTEVEVYDQYLTNEVYGWVAEDWHGEEIGSVWGYYGYDATKEDSDMVQQARDAIDSHIDSESSIKEMEQAGEH